MIKIGQRKRILYIVTQGNWGGAQKNVHDLSLALNRDYQVTVASGTEDEQLKKRLLRAGVRYVGFKHLVRAIHPWHDLLAIFEIYRFIKNEGFDVVHLNSSKAGVVGSIAAKLAGTPKIVFTMHGLVLNEPMGLLKKIFYSLAERISAVYQDTLIAVSKADRDAALRHYLKSPEHITVVHNGLDMSKLGFIPREQARVKLAEFSKTDLKERLLVVTVADFYPAKGLACLVAAAREVLKKIPDAVFILIGRIGPDYEKIKQAVQQNRLESNFLLLTELPVAAPYLKAADLFVLPSVKEGFPYTILEAAAAGLPIVATRVGGVPDILDDESAILVSPGLPEELASAICSLLSDKAASEKIAAAANIRVKKFQLQDMVAATRKVYES